MLEILDPSDEIFSKLRKMSEEQMEFNDRLREKGEELLKLFEEIPNSRRKSIAITHLETSIMFAIKAICYGK